MPLEYIESNDFSFSNSVSKSECFILYWLVSLLRFVGLLSKFVLADKVACAKLAAKFSVISLLNYGVV